MKVITSMLRRFAFTDESPPELIALGLPSKKDRRRLIDQMRISIADREYTICRLELAIGMNHTLPDLPWAGSTV